MFEWGYLFPLQHMVKPSLGCNLFDKILGQSGEWERGLSQGILRDLTEEEGLVFEKVRPFVQSNRWADDIGGKINFKIVAEMVWRYEFEAKNRHWGHTYDF